MFEKKKEEQIHNTKKQRQTILGKSEKEMQRFCLNKSRKGRTTQKERDDNKKEKGKKQNKQKDTM